MFASDLFLEALGGIVPATGKVWAGEATACSHCGKPVEHGDPYDDPVILNTFADTRDLAARGTGVVCGGCFLFRKQLTMCALGAAVVTRDGIYSLHKYAEKAWLFLTPPEPPFFVTQTASQMQHLGWRTPVSLSKDCFVIRRGHQLLTVRPAALGAALDATDAIKARRVAAGEAKAWRSPYVRLDPDLADPMHGTLSAKAVEVMTDDERALFYGLMPGETWALSFLLSGPERIVPTQPPRLELDVSKKRKSRNSNNAIEGAQK